MTLRFNGTAGDGSAIFNLGTGTGIANVRNTGTTAIALGGLTGGPGTQLQGDNSSWRSQHDLHHRRGRREHGI